MNFGKVLKGRTVKGRLKIFQLSGENLVIEKIVTQGKHLDVRTARFSEENSRGFNIDITLTKDTPVGAFNNIITIYTNHDKKPRIDVPLLAEIVEK